MIEDMIAELEKEAEPTRRMLAAVPEDKYSWKPHEKSLTAGALAKHIAMLPQGIVDIVRRESFDVRNAGPSFDPCTSRKELMALFDKSLEFAYTQLRQMTPEEAAGSWRMTNGTATFGQLPRAAALRALLLNHMYHHRGQLSVYLRLLDVPVPSVYGPTADQGLF